MAIIIHLPSSASEEELKNLFKKYGKVQVHLFAQVQIESDDSQAEALAVEELQNTEFHGQPLQLELADEFPPIDPPSFPVDPPPPSGGGSNG